MYYNNICAIEYSLCKLRVVYSIMLAIYSLLEFVASP